MSARAAHALLASILSQLPSGTDDTGRRTALPPDALEAIVRTTVANAPSKNTAGWDACLRREVTGVVSRKAREGGQLDAVYFDDLAVRLDIAVCCAELEAADASLPLAILSDLFDMHTVDACMRLFDWLESRSARLTKNMVPSKGKALILLRQLNSLVRRVSKTGDTAQFNGRILNFLSGAFPLGERSGVNLRGDYAPPWDESVVKGPEGYVGPEERARKKAEQEAEAKAKAEADAKNAAEAAEVEAIAGNSTTDAIAGAVPESDAMEGVESGTATAPSSQSTRDALSNPSLATPSPAPPPGNEPRGRLPSNKPLFTAIHDPILIYKPPAPGAMRAPQVNGNPLDPAPPSDLKIERTPEDDRVEFYHRFWALQTPLSNPSVFQSSPAHPHPTEAWLAFRRNVPKVLAVIDEATKRDRASTISRASQLEKEKERERERMGLAKAGSATVTPPEHPNGLSEDGAKRLPKRSIGGIGPDGRSMEAIRVGTKRKITASEAAAIRETNIRATAAYVVARENTPAHGKKDYFFAKYLTNMDLLELEISDLHFRRQILLQLLILLNYLKTYTPAEKDKWSTPRGARATTRPRRLDLTLSDEDSTWLKDMWQAATDAIRMGTGSLGFRVFADTVNDLLDREKAWARWKNDGCPTFEKPPLPRSELEETKAKRRKLLAPLPPLEHALGTEDLTDTWESGYTGRDDLERPPRHTTFERYVRDYKALNRRIETKEKQLAMSAAKRSGVPTVVATPSTPPPRAVSAAANAGAVTSVPGSPHGLPPKPAAPQGVSSSAGAGAAMELSATPIATPPLPAPTPAAPAPATPPVEVVPKVKLTDAQLEGFLESREILVWRGLRAAAQEGILHQHNKAKPSDSSYVLGDLEKLQAKILQAQAQEAEAAAAAAAKASTSPVGPSTSVSSSATVTSSGTATTGAGPSAGASSVKAEEVMDVDEQTSISGAATTEDATPPGLIPLSLGAKAAETVQAAPGLASEITTDVEMGESKPEVKEEQ